MTELEAMKRDIELTKEVLKTIARNKNTNSRHIQSSGQGRELADK